MAVRLLVLLLATALLSGCSGGSSTSKAGESKVEKDLKGLDPQAKIQALRDNKSLNSMQRSSLISDAQKEAGLAVTGQ